MTDPATSVLSLAVSSLPVVAFLIGLVLLDSYKLVQLSLIVKLILAGVCIAGISWTLNLAWLNWAGVDSQILRRYLGPFDEELLKGLVVIYLIYRNRAGFLVDAAICGFAVGAGFATAENLQYFLSLENAHLVLWIIRGFGTAIMHGGVTALMAVISRYLVDKRENKQVSGYLPGLFVAFVIHSLYNHFYLSPDLSMIVLIVLLPAIFALVFTRSERATRDWLGVGFDTDSELLRMIRSGRASETKIGWYLESVKQRLPGEILVDMLCLARLHLELSIQAKGVLIARQEGFDIKPNRSVHDKFAELKYLEKTIGRTGLLALAPIFNMSSRGLWQFYFLGKK